MGKNRPSFKTQQPSGAYGGFDIPVLQPRTAGVTFEAGAPRAVAKMYADELERHLDEGKSEEEARERAMARIRHAGWVRLRNGKWEQLAPDVRDKVNIAEGHLQPDGTYFVRGVGGFYPNAIKGAHMAFSAERNKRIANNTNRSIADGAPRPALVIGHPNEEQGARGVQLDSVGHPINFREWEGKPEGWLMFDLESVKPEAFQRMKERRLHGLSIGIAKDSNSLNERVGHVALLGGTSQALSHLPATEVFSAVSGNTLCFSADQDFFPERKNTMKMSDKQKACFAALYSACQGVEAAGKSHELGEPDSENKMDEAYAAFKSAKMNFDAESMDETPPTVPGEMEPSESGVPNDTTAAYNAEENLANGGMIPAVTPHGAATPAFASFEAIKDEFSSESGNPAAAFGAICDLVQSQAEAIKGYQLKDKANTNRQRHQSFFGKATVLRKSGRHLPDDKLLQEQFEACFSSKDVDKALALTLRGYESLPAQRTPATFNNGKPVFDANSSNQPRQPAKKLTVSDLAGTKPSITAEDMQFAALSESVSGD